MLRKILITSLLFSSFTSLYGVSDSFMDKLGLDKTNENDTALAVFMYELALKNKINEGKTFQSACVKLNKDSKTGKYDISLGVRKSDKDEKGVFETGKVSFDQNSQVYQNLSSLTSDFSNFFKNAQNKLTGKRGYQPNITLEAYADPQFNGGATRKYGLSDSEIRSGINKSDYQSSLGTRSQLNNKALATARAKAVRDHFFKGSNASFNGFHSPDLDNLKSKPKDQARYSCPKRRGVVVKFNVDPTIIKQNKQGVLEPGFSIASGEKQKQLNISSSINAAFQDLEKLPVECRGETVKVFKDRANMLVGMLKKVKEVHTKNGNPRDNPWKNVFTHLIYNCGKKEFKNIPYCQTARSTNEEQQLYNLASLFQAKQAPGKSALMKSFLQGRLGGAISKLSQASKGLQSDHGTIRGIESVVNCLTVKSKKRCAYDNQFQFVSKAKRDQHDSAFKVKKGLSSFNSAHFNSCFKSKTYYDNNFASHIIPTDHLRDPEGHIRLKFDKNSIPTIKHKHGNFKGYACKACRSGVHFNGKGFDKQSRAKLALPTSNGSSNFASLAHTPAMIKDSNGIDNVFYGKSHPSHEYVNASNQLPILYVYENCHDPEKRKLVKSIPFHKSDSSSKFEVNKKVKLADGQCIMKPLLISSCNHAPDGSQDTDEGVSGKELSVYSLLAGKNIKSAISQNLEEAFEDLTLGILNRVKHCSEKIGSSSADDSELLEGVLCAPDGEVSARPSLPKAGFSAASDCPDVPNSKAI